MTKATALLSLLLASCLGCNDATTQQKTNQAQRTAVAAELKTQGEAMHNAPAGDSVTAGTKGVDP
ncbi:hypothetical protein LF1_54250 [Rubripirellula obstinata]|uniref:Uncharacterized protein n=1 Tax=Rubripirellula obstinata TaxID=406547 RepID=A0A5B1C9T5_9BACT|nr:hypothetical protein [Rubripirellula obstinata]KAA1257276.1 hypothetical protein LF1_54250 [Rubripirellula obstinata]